MTFLLLAGIKGLKDNEVVGHIRRGLSKYCTSILLCGRTVKCAVIGKGEHKHRNGLKVLCKYFVKGPKFMLTNIECVIKII